MTRTMQWIFFIVIFVVFPIAIVLFVLSSVFSDTEEIEMLRESKVVQSELVNSGEERYHELKLLYEELDLYRKRYGVYAGNEVIEAQARILGLLREEEIFLLLRTGLLKEEK